jgi:hypothetical protein
MLVEGSVDGQVVKAIAFEDVPLQYQLSLQVIFNRESSGPIHQSTRRRCLFIAWVIVGFGVEVDISVYELVVHSVSQRAIIIIIIITGTTALCEPWPSSGLFAIPLYSMPHSSSSLHPGF